MKISTKGRYALRMMLELAAAPGNESITIKTVAAHQEISEKYLEQIVIVLSRAGFVKSTRGSQGGYRLARPATDYTVGQILRVIEGDLVPVACMQDEPNLCPRSKECVTLDIWKQINNAVNNVVDHITLADLVGKQQEKDALNAAESDYSI